MLSEQELATLHDEWVEYRYVDPISVVSKAHQDIHSLLDHIEAQEEALGHARETARLLIRATEQLEQAQAEAAAMRLLPDDPALMEQLAGLEHERWSGWMKYQAEHCYLAGIERYDRHRSGEAFVTRWQRLAKTPYENLTEQEKESDRIEVRKTLAVLTAALSGTAGQVPLDALAALELVSSEWKVLTEIDYLRADVQHLQDVAEAAEQLYQAFHKPSMVRWEDTVKLWMSCLHEALRQAGYLREKADAE